MPKKLSIGKFGPKLKKKVCSSRCSEDEDDDDFVPRVPESIMDAINDYVKACGGDTSAKTNRGRRMEAYLEEILHEYAWQQTGKPPSEVFGLCHCVDAIMEVSAWEVRVHPDRYKGWRELPRD